MRFPTTLLALGVAASQLGGGASAPVPPADEPRFTSDGALVRPEGFHQWIFVGASLGLGYSEHGGGPELFHNVYLRRAAYEEFRAGRGFPDGTTLVLELYQPESNAMPARQGRFEGERVAVEAAVKDSKRFEGGWAYFSFDDGRAATARPFPRESCAACHRQHAATDNVFTQFYPALRAPTR